MVAQAAIPIATAVGEFAAPYLIRKAGEIGLTRFIQVYGSAAATAIGLQKTQPVDLQTEKILGMPVSHITGQGEVYSDIEEPKKVEPLKYIDTVHGGKGPLEPIKAKPFPAETEVKKWDESFKAPEKIETTEGFEAPPQEKIVPPGFETPEPLGTDILTKDISKQTEELVPKIKNKITTWEDHFPTIEEATKAAEDVGGTLREFEEGLIEKKITFKKLGNIGGQFFQVLYDGKEVAELSPLEEVVKEGIYKGLKEYNIKFIGDIDIADTVTGLAEAKASVKKYIADGLLDKSEPSPAPNYWQPLRKTFEEATFDKKGNYVMFPEPAHTEKELEELVERVSKKNKKAYGGLIDKPLTGRSRYI